MYFFRCIIIALPFYAMYWLVYSPRSKTSYKYSIPKSGLCMQDRVLYSISLEILSRDTPTFSSKHWPSRLHEMATAGGGRGHVRYTCLSIYIRTFGTTKARNKEFHGNILPSEFVHSRNKLNRAFPAPIFPDFVHFRTKPPYI